MAAIPMTYCLAVAANAGLVLITDSRTSAGVDNISTHSKMHRFSVPGDRQIVLLSAGNLATTQGVIARIRKDIAEKASLNLLNAADMNDVADYVGELNRAQQEKHTGGGAIYEASFIIGGQIGEDPPEIYLVYPQGNHITPSEKSPYLQVGESKYGKPILDRIIKPESTLETAALCGLVSMDSTMRSNLTVGPPIEVAVYEAGSLQPLRHYVFKEDSDYLRELKRAWDANLKDAFNRLPPIAWSSTWDRNDRGAPSAE